MHSSWVDRKQLEALVGRLTFAASITRWGYSFLQDSYDTLYPGDHRRDGRGWPRTVRHTSGLRQELLFERLGVGD